MTPRGPGSADGFRHRLRRAEYVVVASVAVFVALLAAAALLADGQRVLAHVAGLGPGLLVLLLFLSLLNYGARAVRWQVFSRRLGLAVPFPRSALYYVAGFAMTTTPGKLGEAVRLWLLERGHGYSYRRLVPLFLGDRLSDLIAMLVLCLLGAGALAGYWPATLAVVAALGAVSALFVWPRPLLAAMGLLHRVLGRRRARTVAGLRSMLRLTAGLFTARVFSAALALSLAGWLVECAAFYLLLQALGAPIGPLQAVFIFAFAMVAGALTMLPGGLGSVEAAMFALLVALGTSADVALAATAVIRATTLWFAVALGFAALFAALRRVCRSPAQGGPVQPSGTIDNHQWIGRTSR